MSENNKISKETLVEEYFAKNQKEKEVYVTSDCFLFPQRKHALDHANTLDENQRGIESFTNPLNIKVSTEEVTKLKLSDDEKKLLKTELVSKNYTEMKSLVKALKIEVQDTKAQTLIIALEEYKTKLQN